MKTEDREALRRWENYFESLMADVPVIHKNRKEMVEHRAWAYLEAHILGMDHVFSFLNMQNMNLPLFI